MTFAEKIKNFATKVELSTANVFRKSCDQVSVDIAEGSPVSTGRLLGSWAPSAGSQGSYRFMGGLSAWKKGKKDSGIEGQNRAAAMSDLMPRITSATESLSKKESYYFTNNTPYIKQAEYEGWPTGAAPYNMIENAVLNWKLIVKSKALETK